MSHLRFLLYLHHGTPLEIHIPDVITAPITMVRYLLEPDGTLAKDLLEDMK